MSNSVKKADESIKQELQYTEINKLEEINVNESDISKLKNAGHYTIECITCTPRHQLTEIRGISEAKAIKIKDAACKLLAEKMTFKTASQFAKKRQDNMIRITTGSSKLDDLLGGGIECGTITEIFGEFGTGKTQICHQLAVTSQFKKNKGGTEGRVLYIDTSGTFKSSRIRQIADRYGVDVHDTLNNISFARAYTTDHQMKLLKEAKQLMTQSRYGLVIIDSGTALFRTEYTERAMIKDRDLLLSGYFGELLKLCDIFGIAVVITNQIISSGVGLLPFCDESFYHSCGAGYEAYGDEVVGHSSTTRIWLRKGSKNTRIARIYASCDLPDTEEIFVISDHGIDNY